MAESPLASLDYGRASSRPASLRRCASAGALSSLSGWRSGAGDNSPRVGRLTLEERRLRILRYQQKRLHRVWDRKVKCA